MTLVCRVAWSSGRYKVCTARCSTESLGGLSGVTSTVGSEVRLNSPCKDNGRGTPPRRHLRLLTQGGKLVAVSKSQGSVGSLFSLVLAGLPSSRTLLRSPSCLLIFRGGPSPPLKSPPLLSQLVGREHRGKRSSTFLAVQNFGQKLVLELASLKEFVLCLS